MKYKAQLHGVACSSKMAGTAPQLLLLMMMIIAS
jgi:hypothetical protein